jgi:hypothetical protein
MRAGPLSDPNVLEVLQTYYVPVFAQNEDYHDHSKKAESERAEYHRIHAEALAKGFTASLVHVYILTPDGQVQDAMRVESASRTATCLELLKKNAARIDPKTLKSISRRDPPASDSGEFAAFILRTRSMDGRAAWTDFDPEVRVTLSLEHLKTLLPPPGATIGTKWNPGRTCIEALFRPMIPAIERDASGIESKLSGTIIAVEQSMTRVRLEGQIVLKDPNHPENPLLYVELIGVMETDANGRLRAFKLASQQAMYGFGEYAVSASLL